MYLGPLTFAEVFQPKPWGGRALARVAGKSLPPRAPIGESWEISDRPAGMSVAASGPVAGRTLRDLMKTSARALIGRRRAAGRFPLLIKVIHARAPLSVQVHPDDRLARTMRLKDPGKTEAWYILRAAPGAWAVTGLKSARDLPRLRQLAATGRIRERLRMEPLHAGDALFCPAGAVHGNGPGCVFLEVQQNSDATFRFYDWDRPGLDGKPRPLHIEESARAVGSALKTVTRPKPRLLRDLPFPAERLVSCDKFVMDRWRVGVTVRRTKPPRFEILFVVAGHGLIDDGRWPALELKKGRTVLVPACVRRYTIQEARPLTLVRLAEPE